MLFQTYCSACHGDAVVSGGVLPDLRYSSALADDQWFDIVLDGLLQPNGMVSFSKELTHNDAAAIRAYVIQRAHQSMDEAKSPLQNNQPPSSTATPGCVNLCRAIGDLHKLTIIRQRDLLSLSSRLP